MTRSNTEMSNSKFELPKPMLWRGLSITAAIAVGLGVSACSPLTTSDSAVTNIKKACSEIPVFTKPGVTVLTMNTGLRAAYLDAKNAVTSDTGQPIDASWKVFETAVEAEGALWHEVSLSAGANESASAALQQAPPNILKDYPEVSVDSVVLSTCLVAKH